MILKWTPANNSSALGRFCSDQVMDFYSIFRICEEFLFYIIKIAGYDCLFISHH